MLARRMIPCLDVKEGRVVKGVNFVICATRATRSNWRRATTPGARTNWSFWTSPPATNGAMSSSRSPPRVAEQVFIPFTVGGGIRTVEDFRKILRAGADKVAVNTAAVQRKEILTEAAEQFGRQCVVVAIDPKRVGENPDGSPHWEVFVHGGRTPTGLDALEWAQEAEALGAGEILLTSMDRDGTQIGFDLELTRAVAQRVHIPVIASGGAGTPQHCLEAVTEGQGRRRAHRLDGPRRHYTIAEIKSYLRRTRRLRPLKQRDIVPRASA